MNDKDDEDAETKVKSEEAGKDADDEKDTSVTEDKKEETKVRVTKITEFLDLILL